MSRTKLAGTVAGLTLAGTAVVGGAAMAVAATNTPTPAPSSSSSSATSGTAKGGTDRPAPHSHSAATADETAKVTAAVKAKDSAVTVTKVEKDEDGSFDAHGTKDGKQVHVDVSADYATVDIRTGGPGRGGPGGEKDTPVTGAEAAKVTSAVKAKNSTVTITEVRKDPDGSYDALGTKAGSPVFYDVSKDLATITERAGGPGGPGGPDRHGDHDHGGQAGSGGTMSTNPSDANGGSTGTATPSSSATT